MKLQLRNRTFVEISMKLRLQGCTLGEISVKFTRKATWNVKSLLKFLMKPHLICQWFASELVESATLKSVLGLTCNPPRPPPRLHQLPNLQQRVCRRVAAANPDAELGRLGPGAHGGLWPFHLSRKQSLKESDKRKVKVLWKHGHRNLAQVFKKNGSRKVKGESCDARPNHVWTFKKGERRKLSLRKAKKSFEEDLKGDIARI